MKLLDTLRVYHGPHEKLIEIYQGDLTELTPDEAVDVLVVSAFPNDYTPTRTSLIGALHRKGISVAALAGDKYVDPRRTFSCWLSQEIVHHDPGIQFRRILCFEPFARRGPPEVVGDIFRSLAPLLGDDPPIRIVAMLLVACGDQSVPMPEILGSPLDAAVHWMTLGFPLQRLKIVAHSPTRGLELQQAFSRLKEGYRHPILPASRAREYDVFVSYAHKDEGDVSALASELRRLRPDLRIYFDRLSLNIGAAWQRESFEAIDASHRVVPMFSPSYLSSKVCLEEFNIALHRRRDTDDELLFPIHRYSAALPTDMRALVNCQDCREGSKGRLRLAGERLLSCL